MYSNFSPMKNDKGNRKMKSEEYRRNVKKRKPDFSEQRKAKRGE